MMLKYEFSLEETNMILASLGKAPYEQVVGMIEKIKQQAEPQLKKPEEFTAVNDSIN